MTLGEKLRQLRGDRSLREVEALSGVNFATLHRMERDYNCTLDNLIKLVRAYNVSMAHLFDGVQLDGVKEIYEPLPFDED